MVEQQTKELCVDAARGAGDSGQKADAAIVSVVRQVLCIFVLGGFLPRLVDVGRVV